MICKKGKTRVPGSSNQQPTANCNFNGSLVF